MSVCIISSRDIEDHFLTNHKQYADYHNYKYWTQYDWSKTTDFYDERAKKTLFGSWLSTSSFLQEKINAALNWFKSSEVNYGDWMVWIGQGCLFMDCTINLEYYCGHKHSSDILFTTTMSQAGGFFSGVTQQLSSNMFFLRKSRFTADFLNWLFSLSSTNMLMTPFDDDYLHNIINENYRKTLNVSRIQLRDKFGMGINVTASEYRPGDFMIQIERRYWKYLEYAQIISKYPKKWHTKMLINRALYQQNNCAEKNQSDKCRQLIQDNLNFLTSLEKSNYALTPYLAKNVIATQPSISSTASSDWSVDLVSNGPAEDSANDHGSVDLVSNGPTNSLVNIDKSDGSVSNIDRSDGSVSNVNDNDDFDNDSGQDVGDDVSSQPNILYIDNSRDHNKLSTEKVFETLKLISQSPGNVVNWLSQGSADDPEHNHDPFPNRNITIHSETNPEHNSTGVMTIQGGTNPEHKHKPKTKHNHKPNSMMTIRGETNHEHNHKSTSVTAISNNNNNIDNYIQLTNNDIINMPQDVLEGLDFQKLAGYFQQTEIPSENILPIGNQIFTQSKNLLPTSEGFYPNPLIVSDDDDDDGDSYYNNGVVKDGVYVDVVKDVSDGGGVNDVSDDDDQGDDSGSGVEQSQRLIGYTEKNPVKAKPKRKLKGNSNRNIGMQSPPVGQFQILGLPAPVNSSVPENQDITQSDQPQILPANTDITQSDQPQILPANQNITQSDQPQTPPENPDEQSDHGKQDHQDASDISQVIIYAIAGTTGIILLKILHSLHVHGAFRRLRRWFALRRQMKIDSNKRRFHRMQQIEKQLLRGDSKARSSFIRITNPHRNIRRSSNRKLSPL